MLARLSVFSAVLSFSLVLGSQPGEAADDWAQWRGAKRDGKVAGTAWPESLEHLSKKWSVKLGPSYSGPIVVGDRVFTTATEEKKFEVVKCLRRDTGEEIWSASWEGAMRVPFFAASNGSWIRATPAYSDGRLYVGGMRDVLVCLDASNGNIIWKKDFVADLKTSLPSFGFASSPMIEGGHVFVQAGGALTKLDKVTGEIVWQSLKDGGGMSGGAFSSPMSTKLAGQHQLVVQTRTRLAGVDPESGKELWSQKVPAFRGMNILTPCVWNNAVFTSSYGGKSFRYEVTQKDGTFDVGQVWEQKSQGYMSSPVIIDGHVYLHLRNQRFTCINLNTGKETWTTKPYGKYWSLIANGNRILALDERGELLLIQANPEEFELQDSKKISDEQTCAHLRISGNEIIIREQDAMTTLNWAQ